MQKYKKSLICLVLFQMATSLAYANSLKMCAESTFGSAPDKSPRQILLDRAIQKTLNDFKSQGLKPDEIAATLIDFRAPNEIASYRGEEMIYPASVVKMFYMARLEKMLEDGKLTMTPELKRGLTDMITVSSNEATQYVLDVITDTSSGAELSKEEFEKWGFKRNSVNRYFKSKGYKNINVNQKTFCEDAYGREQQFRGEGGKNRNMLTTNATAKLLQSIATGNEVSKERSKTMMDLMVRDWETPGTSANPDNQEFISGALKPGTKLWSKEGWTSKTRHDAAYIETPDGQKFVLVVFTENNSSNREIIPSVARTVLEGIGEIK